MRNLACVQLISTRDELTINELVEGLDDTLFHMILYDETHIIHYLLPPATSTTYNLRQRRHNSQLTTKADDRNFIIRKLYEDIILTFHFIILKYFLYFAAIRPYPTCTTRDCYNHLKYIYIMHIQLLLGYIS